MWHTGHEVFLSYPMDRLIQLTCSTRKGVKVAILTRVLICVDTFSTKSFAVDVRVKVRKIKMYNGLHSYCCILAIILLTSYFTINSIFFKRIMFTS